MYLFYNGFELTPSKSKKAAILKEDIKNYGLSYAYAEELSIFKGKKSRWKIPTFWDIHPKYGNPFYKLFESSNLQKITSLLLNQNSDSVRFYSLNEIRDDSDWKEISKETSSERQSTSISEVDYLAYPYRPKYRLVFRRNFDDMNQE